MNAYTGRVPETERVPDWRAQAACLGRAKVMHPDSDEDEIAAAKAVCAGCWVARECFWDAVATDDMQHGVRAGLRANERRAVLTELQRRREEKAVAS